MSPSRQRVLRIDAAGLEPQALPPRHMLRHAPRPSPEAACEAAPRPCRGPKARSEPRRWRVHDPLDRLFSTRVHGACIGGAGGRGSGGTGGAAAAVDADGPSMLQGIAAAIDACRPAAAAGAEPLPPARHAPGQATG